MSDTIYRDDAVKAVCKGCLKKNPHCRHHWDCPMLTNLGKLPSADRPQGEWIPCSERLPSNDELMLVTYVDSRLEAMDIWIGWHEMENVWYIDGEAHSNEYGNEVIAWMPLPKPYGERKESE